MSEFNQLCKTVEELNPLEYAAIVAAKTAKIMPKLKEIAGGRLDAINLYATFMIASVYADGKLDESEYLLMLPLLKVCFGPDFDYDSAKAMVKEFKPEGRELKKVVNDLVDILGEADEDLKDDIVTVCLLVCAVDGKITLKEKNYIKQLIK